MSAVGHVITYRDGTRCDANSV